MDWNRADKELHHARTGKRLTQKNVANKTVLKRGGKTLNEDGSCYEDPDIWLWLFNEPIITWRQNGEIVLSNRSWWPRTTQNRLNQSLPSGFRVYTAKPFWFLRTPRGTRFWRNGMCVAADGRDVDRLYQYDAT